MKKALRRKGIVSLLVLFSLSISLTAGEAFAVTQSEIDDIQRQRESLTAQREQSQAKVGELQAEQASSSGSASPAPGIPPRPRAARPYPRAFMPLLLLSKSNPLRWASICFRVQAKNWQHLYCFDVT